MTELKLYEGDEPVVVSPDALLDLVAFIAARKARQVFFDEAKQLKLQLTVTNEFRRALVEFLIDKNLDPKLGDPLGFEGLFDALELIESQGEGLAFKKVQFPKAAQVVAEPELVNFVKKFLFEQIKNAGPLLEAAPKSKKVDQVVSSPAGTTTCFPK